MFSKKTLMVASIIVLIAVNIVALFVSGFRRFNPSYGPEHISIPLIAPFQEVAVRSVRFVKDIWNHYFFLISAAKTNDILKKKINKAAEKENLYREVMLSNFRLRKFLNFRETINREVIGAEVIGKDPSPWFKSIVINRGAVDGVEKGLPAVVPEGIAGVVTEVSHHYSKILLIIDQNCSVDALVQQTRSRGIIKGTSSSDRCIFKYVLRKHEANNGDVVVSSGLDNIFPKGLRIGEISEVVRAKSGTIFQDIVVTPYVDFEKLEEVFILRPLPLSPS